MFTMYRNWWRYAEEHSSDDRRRVVDSRAARLSGKTSLRQFFSRSLASGTRVGDKL